MSDKITAYIEAFFTVLSPKEIAVGDSIWWLGRTGKDKPPKAYGPYPVHAIDPGKYGNFQLKDPKGYYFLVPKESGPWLRYVGVAHLENPKS